MKAAPLQLLTYVAEDLRMELAPGYDLPDDPEPGEIEDFFSITLDPLSYARPGQLGDLRLTVQLNADADVWRFYRTRMVLRGQFELVDPDPPSRDELDRFFLVSAATVLYGIARGLCTQLTASSPYPRLVLPVVTFTDEVDDLMAQRAPKETPGE